MKLHYAATTVVNVVGLFGGNGDGYVVDGSRTMGKEVYELTSKLGFVF